VRRATEHPPKQQTLKKQIKMATLLIKLDTRRANRRGEYPVKLAISAHGKTSYVGLSLSLPASAWQGDGLQRPVHKSFPAAKVYNDSIENFYIEKRASMLKIEKINSLTADEIKKHLLKDLHAEKPPVTFYAAAETFMEGCRKQKTKDVYTYTVNTIKKYTKKALRFQDIDTSFLRDFSSWLEKAGSSINTRSIHFRNIRAIFNRAITDKLIDREIYPFDSFKIKSEEKENENLTAEQIRALSVYDFKTKSLRMARDFWMLSFFLCGINPIDLFYLQKPDAQNRIRFTRSKEEHVTSDKIKIRIQPEAERIIADYKAAEDSPFLLCFEAKYASYETFYHFIEKKVRETAKIIGFERLTLYWARYSFATIADAIGTQEKVISKALGHADRSVAGKRYINFDWNRVDVANRAVIDAVFG
jgi:integrase